MNIIFLIDEKKRDLLTSLYIASKTKNKKIYFLTSNNLKKAEKKNFKNSIIILNNFRYALMHYYVFFKFFYNSKLVINDTEGCGGNDGLYLLENTKIIENYLGIIEQYWVWGQELYNRLIKKYKRIGIFKLIGSPKFSNLIKVKNKKNKKILINSNFTLFNPKYSAGIDDEIKASNNTGHALSFEHVNHYKYQEKEFKKTVFRIISKFKNEQFILRTHPFEKDDDWKKLLSNFSNVKISNNNLDVIKDIENAKLLIHNNCTTSIEAYHRNVPSVSLDWLFDKKYDFNISRKFSFKCKNFDDLENTIKKIITCKFKNEFTSKCEKYIYKYYLNPNKKDPIILASNSLNEIFIKNSNERIFKLIYLFQILKYIIVLFKFLITGDNAFFKVKKLKNIKIHDFKLIKKNYNLNFSVKKNKSFFEINFCK